MCLKRRSDFVLTKQTIQQKIEMTFNQLSKGQQKAATFILHNMTYVGVHAASEVGKQAQVSETTVIRLCYALGLSGYAQLQKEITTYLFEQNNKTSSLKNYLTNKQSLQNTTKQYETLMIGDAKRVMHVAEQISEADFSVTTQHLHHCQTLYIVGFGASYLAAQWMHFAIGLLRPRIVLVPHDPSSFVRVLQEMTSADMLVVFSFHRYFKETVLIAKEAKSKGVEVVAITDAPISPVVPHATICFVQSFTGVSTIDTMPTIISFINALIAGMTTQDPTYYEQQRLIFDEYTNVFMTDRWS